MDYDKGGLKMEIAYNVKYKFKNIGNKTKAELKYLFNKKLLNIILKQEKERIGQNNF